METKEIKIEVPEGYEIDQENSTFECIKFKPNGLTYKDIAKKLFPCCSYNICDDGRIKCYGITGRVDSPNNCVTIEQAKKLLALNKLINVAKYLNGDWKPDFENSDQEKYVLCINHNNNIKINTYFNCNSGIPCFKTEELAQQAIDILGEETIRLALSQV